MPPAALDAAELLAVRVVAVDDGEQAAQERKLLAEYLCRAGLAEDDLGRPRAGGHPRVPPGAALGVPVLGLVQVHEPVGDEQLFDDLEEGRPDQQGKGPAGVPQRGWPDLKAEQGAEEPRRLAVDAAPQVHLDYLGERDGPKAGPLDGGRAGRGCRLAAVEAAVLPDHQEVAAQHVGGGGVVKLPVRPRDVPQVLDTGRMACPALVRGVPPDPVVLEMVRGPRVAHGRADERRIPAFAAARRRLLGVELFARRHGQRPHAAAGVGVVKVRKEPPALLELRLQLCDRGGVLGVVAAGRLCQPPCKVGDPGAEDAAGVLRACCPDLHCGDRHRRVRAQLGLGAAGRLLVGGAPRPLGVDLLVLFAQLFAQQGSLPAERRTALDLKVVRATGAGDAYDRSSSGQDSHPGLTWGMGGLHGCVSNIFRRVLNIVRPRPPPAARIRAGSAHSSPTPSPARPPPLQDREPGPQ